MMSMWKKANDDKLLSTVGIGPVFVRSLPYTLPEEECSSLIESSGPVLTSEIVGTIKSRPEDFVVREIGYLPSSRGGFSPRIAGLDENPNCSLSSDFIDKHACRKIESAASFDNTNDTNTDSTTIMDQGEYLPKDVAKDPPPSEGFYDLNTKRVGSDNSSTYDLTHPNTTENFRRILHFCCSGNNRQQRGVTCTTISNEAPNVLFSEDHVSSAVDIILEQLGLLQELALDEIQDIWLKGFAMNSTSVAVDESKNFERHNRVWIPTSNLFQETDISGDLKEMWKQLHQYIRQFYPMLKTEVSNSGPSADMLYCDVEGSNTNVRYSTETSIQQNSTKPWIYAEIDKVFYPLAPYLALPRVDLLSLYNFRREGPVESGRGTGHRHAKKRKGLQPHEVLLDKAQHADGLKEENGSKTVLLRLRPELPKDGRRNVHNILSSTSRNRGRDFDTFTKNNVPLDAKDDDMKSLVSGSADCSSIKEATHVAAIVVQWSRLALARSRKTHNQKNLPMSQERNDANYTSTLCVLRKEQIEHQSAVYELARTIKCRPFDIGLAGIKDMQAITYQFCSLRNIDTRRAEQGNRSSKNIELSQFERLRPGFLLDRGMLLGNRFDILVQHLGRIERKSLFDENQADNQKVIIMERIVPCRASHITSMVNRIEENGFINFYGEQRVGSAGASNLAGVRSFDVGEYFIYVFLLTADITSKFWFDPLRTGCAMLQRDFSKALDLVMTGRSDLVHSPSEDEIKVREVWRSSGGNARATLDAFPKNSSIMVRERDLMKGLLRFGDALEAFRGIPRNVRMFWIHAYQSYVWNLVATERIKRWGARPVVGDLYLAPDKDRDISEQVHIVSDPESVDISQIVLPVRI
ncbi:hypothetical protein ACHAWX_005518 [Stephanocyclus meneghinianus]